MEKKKITQEEIAEEERQAEEDRLAAEEAANDTVAPVITATYGGVAINNGDTVGVEKYSGIQAVVTINDGTLYQDKTGNNTVSQSIIYTATDENNNTSTFTVNYNVVDTVAPTGTLGTPTIDDQQ